MPSKAEQIADRIKVLLTGATAAQDRVYRDREDAMTREESPALLVEIVDEDSRALGGASGLLSRNQVDEDTLRIAVTTCVRSANWQSVADGVRVAAVAAIFADPQLRAIAAEIARDRCEWRAQSADVPFGYAAQILRFRYHTRAHALDSSL